VQEPLFASDVVVKAKFVVPSAMDPEERLALTAMAKENSTDFKSGNLALGVMEVALAHFIVSATTAFVIAATALAVALTPALDAKAIVLS